MAASEHSKATPVAMAATDFIKTARSRGSRVMTTAPANGANRAVDNTGQFISITPSYRIRVVKATKIIMMPAAIARA